MNTSRVIKLRFIEDYENTHGYQRSSLQLYIATELTYTEKHVHLPTGSTADEMSLRNVKVIILSRNSLH
jgi:hypothetical protein